MRNFIHHDIKTIEQINSESGRQYALPSSIRVPSVTTVCGLLSRDSIKEWRAKVGETEANRISGTASSRGTTIHNLSEKYLKEEDYIIKDKHKAMFNKMIPYLDKIDNIHALETRLYTEKLKVAGTVDIIGEYEGKLSTIDLKTSAKVKKKEWISSYFFQTAVYSFMFTELTDIVVKDMVIIIGVDNNDTQIFKEKVIDWIPGFINLRKQFKLEYGY